MTKGGTPVLKRTKCGTLTFRKNKEQTLRILKDRKIPSIFGKTKVGIDNPQKEKERTPCPQVNKVRDTYCSG